MNPLQTGDEKILYDDENKPIKWVYFERLVKFAADRNFHSMHKMTQAHIDFHQNPMKVILAIQTLSHRTANAIQYLMLKKYSQFDGAEATVKFIKMCADIFAVLNSTKFSEHSENPLKRPISKNNAAQIFECFTRFGQYLKGIIKISTI